MAEVALCHPTRQQFSNDLFAHSGSPDFAGPLNLRRSLELGIVAPIVFPMSYVRRGRLLCPDPMSILEGVSA